MDERELPELRIFPVDALVLHEETDPDRTTRLVDRLRGDTQLKNPPIVAPIPDSERFVVLDGANRTTSLRALGIPHILVQVVDYDRVELDTWNHVVVGIETATLFARIRSIRNLKLERASLSLARALLTARRCIGYVICTSGEIYLMRGATTLRDEASLLNQIVRTYRGDGKIFRIKTDNLAEHGEYYEGISAIIAFPRFTPADIINLASMDEKLPTGITRHIIPQRALRVNYPISRLADPALTVDDKNRDLTAFVGQRLQSRSVRFYQESTVLFDE